MYHSESFDGDILEVKNAADYLNPYYTETCEKLVYKFDTDLIPNELLNVPVLCTKRFTFNFVSEKAVKEILNWLPTMCGIT